MMKEKKVVVLSIVCFIFIFLIQWVFIGSFLRDIQREQLKVYENMVGGIKTATSISEEEMRDIVFSDITDEKVQKGNEFFKKFGYDPEMSIVDNKFFYNDSKSLYIFLIVSFLTSIILCSLVVLVIVRRMKREVLALSNDIQKLTYRSKYEKRDESGDGAISLLNSRVNKLDTVITKSMSEVNGERKVLKELINDLSHQIKTPISSLKLSNSFLKDEELTESERIEFLNTSTEDIERLEWLSDGLVQIARLETGIVNLNIKPNKLGETLIDGINGVYAKAMEKNITLEFNEFSEVIIDHDYRWTKEAIINILDNAIKYTEPGGRVRISLEDVGDLAKIVIQDNGSGISQEEIYKVFKRFYRGKDLEVQRKEGSGLGLYLSRRIVEGQNGTIGLVSEKGLGSTFTINFYRRILS